MPELIPADSQQQRDYAENDPNSLYPLFGWIEVASGEKCLVEDLRSRWSRNDPQFEIMAPDGYHFTWYDSEEVYHTKLVDERDDIERDAQHLRCVPCSCEDPDQ